jgi:glycerate kinase
VPGRYLSLRDGTAVVDLASVSGIGLMAKLDPLGAQTVGLGQVLRRAVQDGATRISMGVGGSASTDGGLGALTALGVRAIGPGRRPLPTGGGNLIDLVAVETAFLLDPPPGGVEILADVDIPLLGPGGAAAVFGPQKGAGPAEIAQLDAGLARFAALLGGDPSAPGAGAAGGTGYGFATAWGARFVPGASRIAELSGLVGALASADVLILGEGRLDATSLAGKVVGNGLRISSRVPWRFIVAGHVELEADQAAPDVRTVSLTDLAGSAEYSMAHPAEILTKAGAAIAREVTTAA